MFGSVNNKNTFNSINSTKRKFNDKSTRLERVVPRSDVVLPQDCALGLMREDEVARNNVRNNIIKNVKTQLEINELENSRVDEWKREIEPVFPETTKRIETIVNSPIVQDEIKDNWEEWLDDPVLNEPLPIQSEPELKRLEKTPRIFNSQICKVHNRTYTKICPSCHPIDSFKVIKSKLGRLTKKLKANHVSTQEQCIQLRGKAEVNKLRNQVATLLKQQPKARFYWTVEGKPYSDPIEVARLITMYNFRAIFHVGLPGGMKPNKQPVKVVKRSDGKANNQVKALLNQKAQNHHQEPKLRTKEKEIPQTEWIYCTPVPVYKDDPNWKHRDCNLIEQQVQLFKRNTLLQKGKYSGWDIDGTEVFQKYRKGYRNFLPELQNGEIYLPPMTYYADGSCAYYNSDEVGPFTLLVKLGGVVHHYEFENAHIEEPVAYYGGFARHPILMKQPTNDREALAMIELPCGCDTCKEDPLIVHPHVLEKAFNLLAHKPTTPYVKRQFVEQLIKWYNNSVHKEYGDLEPHGLETIFTYTMLKVVKNQAFAIPETKEILKNQRKVTEVFLNPPNPDPEKSLLLTITGLFLPPPVQQYLRDISNNVSLTVREALSILIQKFKQGLQFIKSKLTDLLESLVGLCATFFVGEGFPFHAFPALEMKYSVLLEELIKTVPLGGIAVALKEMYMDHKLKTLTWTKFLKRMAFHNVQLLLPQSILLNLLTLPLRYFVHYKYNKYVLDTTVRVDFDNLYPLEDRGPRMNQVSDEEHTLPLETSAVTRHQVMYIPEPELIREKVQEGIYAVEMPSELYDRAREGLENQVNSKNKVHMHNQFLARTGYPMKNSANFINFALKRQYQAPTIKEVRPFIKTVFKQVGKALCDSLDYEQITFDQWAENSPKKQLYKKAEEQVNGDYDNVKYHWTLQTKINESGSQEIGRTYFSTDLSYTVTVAPMIYSLQQAMKKGPFSGKLNWQTFYPKLPKPTYVLYAATRCDEVEEFLTKGAQDPTAVYIALVGDDSSVLYAHQVASCDFSRYDSTQHPWFHKLFTRFLPGHLYQREFEVYQKQQTAPIYYEPPEDGNRRIVMPQTSGLKTGCMETSVSNTLLTALTIVSAIIDEPSIVGESLDAEKITSFMKLCGFIPKMNVTKIQDGFEFLKRGWVTNSAGKIVCVPLLSNFAKLGKCEKDPKTLVPFGKIKSLQQCSIDFDYMMLNSMFARDSFPYLTELFEFYDEHRTVSKEEKLSEEPYKLHSQHAGKVRDSVVFKWWMQRYSINKLEIDSIFSKLRNLDRPACHSSPTMVHILDVDYGRDQL